MDRSAVVRIPVTGAGRGLLPCLLLLALAACMLALLSGVLASISYTDHEPALRSVGLTLQHLRPVHESAALGWVFLGGIACVHCFLRRSAGPETRARKISLGAQIALFSIAGAGIVASLLAGSFSGREYFGYHPVFSLPILLGWLFFAWSFFSQVGFSLRGRPVYVYQWAVAIVLFVVTYCEGHLYLLDAFLSQPVWDLSIQWKAWGTMGGSFNLLAYGSLMYVAGLIRGDDSYAYSRTAFAFLWVGLLNIFTNYGHHTYHVPQSVWIHRISFGVSMLELLILAKVLLDVTSLLREVPGPGGRRLPDRFFRSATFWNLFLLTLALAISIPPINAMIHGTHVVVTHAMGSMIGLDTMILWGALSYLGSRLIGRSDSAFGGRRAGWTVGALNAFLAAFVTAFFWSGIAVGWQRYAGPSAPDFSVWQVAFPAVMVSTGMAFAGLALWMVARWMAALLKAAVS